MIWRSVFVPSGKDSPALRALAERVFVDAGFTSFRWEYRASLHGGLVLHVGRPK